MSMRISKLFGIDIYDSESNYKGKVYDLILDLEKGKIETITTEPLKVKTKADAKKILSEKSIPYKNVRSVKDILLLGRNSAPSIEPNVEVPSPSIRYRYRR